MGDFDEFYVHTATVTPVTGQSGYGVDQYGTPADYIGFWDGKQRLIRTNDGQQTVSAGTFYTSPATPIHTDDKFACANITGRVVAIEVHTSGTLGLPDHLAVSVV